MFQKLTPATADNCFQVKLYCSTGVCPFGAQVLTRCGRSEMPDSSMKMMIRLSLVAFFERRPALGLPLPNSRLITLHGTFRRPLAGEAQPLEQPPYAGLAISLTSECLDQLANTSQGPQIAAVTLRQRACLQRCNKAFLIIRVQQRRPTRAGCTTQTASPARRQRLLPPSHRSSAHT